MLACPAVDVVCVAVPVRVLACPVVDGVCVAVPVRMLACPAVDGVCVLQYLYAKRAEEILGSHNKSQPLFLYLPFQSVHAPMEVLSRLSFVPYLLSLALFVFSVNMDLN